MVKCPMRRPLLVQTLVGEMQADQIYPNVSLFIKKENFTVTLIVLESLKIRVVLGNGWLCAHKGVIHDTRCIMLLTTPSGKRIEYQGGRLLSEEDENDQLEDRYTADSKVDHEFTEVIAEKQTILEELNRRDDLV
jgi:hypothetical protein